MADVSELDAAIERSRFPDGTYPMTLEGLQIHIDTAKRLADVAVNISNDMDDLEDPDDHDGRIPLAASLTPQQTVEAIRGLAAVTRQLADILAITLHELHALPRMSAVCVGTRSN
jgi:hypothetical protein